MVLDGLVERGSALLATALQVTVGREEQELGRPCPAQDQGWALPRREAMSSRAATMGEEEYLERDFTPAQVAMAVIP